MHHDDVIKRKYFPRHWPFVRGIHRSPNKAQWRGILMFSMICAWPNGWVNNRDTGDLRHHRAHYDVTIMMHYLGITDVYTFTWIRQMQIEGGSRHQSLIRHKWEMKRHMNPITGNWSFCAFPLAQTFISAADQSLENVGNLVCLNDQTLTLMHNNDLSRWSSGVIYYWNFRSAKIVRK